MAMLHDHAPQTGSRRVLKGISRLSRKIRVGRIGGGRYDMTQDPTRDFPKPFSSNCTIAKCITLAK